MFIAHLPAAWLAFRALAPHNLSRAAFLAGMAGALAPDLDLVWFYAIDSSRHHHSFLTHRPALWAGALALGLALRRPALAAFACGALLHMLLDSITGQIAWAWPLSEFAQPLVTVPARFARWQLNFLLHWSFALELALCLAALLRWLRQRKTRAARPGFSNP